MTLHVKTAYPVGANASTAVREAAPEDWALDVTIPYANIGAVPTAWTDLPFASPATVISHCNQVLQSYVLGRASASASQVRFNTTTFTNVYAEAGGDITVATFKSWVQNANRIQVRNDAGTIRMRQGSTAGDGSWRTVNQPALKLSGVWRNASVMYTKVAGVWRETWPTNNAASPKIVGVAYRAQSEYLPGIPGTDFLHTYPAGAPRYKVIGDKAQINSARVEIRMTPASPKSPVEHTFSWDITHDWGIYKVSWRVDASTTKYYYAGMTHAEAAAIALPKYATLIWSPREGGWFAYMPVCWDVSGVTVPMRDDAAGGLDAHSGYAPFPPGVAASSTLSNYTVANGYTDQEASNGYFGYSAAAIASITIILRNAGGGVLSQFGPVALAYDTAVHVPGLGAGPALLLDEQDQVVVQSDQFYWPQEYRTLFDNMEVFGQAYTVLWDGDGPRGDGLWKVLDRDGAPAGDFGLGFRYDAPGLIEITSSNVRPDLVGEQIMFHMQAHLLSWCPTEYVIAPPPDPMTLAVMKGWGWRPITELFAPLGFDFPAERQAHLDRCIYARSDPMYNRFPDLGLPPWQEVARV